MTSGRLDRDALRGRVAVVVGATRGAGRGIAAALGEAGATVICSDAVCHSNLQFSARIIATAGQNATGVPDVLFPFVPPAATRIMAA